MGNRLSKAGSGQGHQAQASQASNHRLSRSRLLELVEPLRRSIPIVGKSPLLEDALVAAAKFAPLATDSVLVTGETGTGKELIAELIHGLSGRRGPCVIVNCGAIPEQIAGTELFGHTKGAFTGAVASSRGKFLAANGGTIFLDEIGELPASVQIMLLRVLNTRKPGEPAWVTPIGSAAAVPCDVRVICATNVDLEDSVRSGKFREDLWYRISPFRIKLPSLAERPEDVPLLVRHIEAEFIRTTPDYALAIFSDEAIDFLVHNIHLIGGNIRGLLNIVKRAMLLADGEFVQSSDPSLAEILNVSTDDDSTTATQTRKFTPMVVGEITESNIRRAILSCGPFTLSSREARYGTTIVAIAHNIGVRPENIEEFASDHGIDIIGIIDAERRKIFEAHLGKGLSRAKFAVQVGIPQERINYYAKRLNITITEEMFKAPVDLDVRAEPRARTLS